MLESAPMALDDKAKLKFELANANFQSIGRAQGIYVTALLSYICLVWVLPFVRKGSFHLGVLNLDADGVWNITPFVLLVLTLTYIGTVTAARPALTRLHEAEKELLGTQEHTFFDFDTHKNIIDYLVILQLHPLSKTRMPKDDGHSKPWSERLHQLVLPSLFVGSAYTSWRVVLRLPAVSHTASVLGWTCLVIQLAFSMRPICRCLGRLFGAERTHAVYN